MSEDDEIPEVGDGHDIPRGARDAPLVARVQAGDTDAFGELYDRWFNRVLDLAYRIVHDRHAAADVAQDTFLSAWRNIDRLEDPNAFGGWMLRIARNGALDRQRRDPRARPYDAERLAMIEPAQFRPEDLLGTLHDPQRVAEDTSYAALLWDAADALGDRDREVLDLSLRHGLAPAEIADVVGLNRNAANQLVHRVHQRLTTALGARVLWRGGQPECAALRAELVAADVEHFDADAVRVTDRHAANCDACNGRRQFRLSPAEMFSAIPILALPALKSKIAFALDAQGVPMEGSAAFGAGDGSARRARRIMVGGAIVVLVVVLAIVIGAVTLSHEPSAVVTISATSTTSTSSTSSSTTTSSTSTTSTSTSTTTTTVAPVVVPITEPPTAPPTIPTTTTVPPVTTTTVPRVVTLSISPNPEPTNYPLSQGPVLAWNVVGADHVHVYDSVGVFSSQAPTGSQQVCPDTSSTTTCGATPRSYVYTLDAFDANGRRFAHRTVTLVIQ